MKKILFLNMAICLIALSGFSQNAENTKSGLRINHNENETISIDSKNTQKIVLRNQKNSTKRSETYEKDAVYASHKPENELVERRDNSSIHENTPQPKSGTRSTTIYSQNFESVNTGSLTTSNSQQDGWLIEGTTNSFYHSSYYVTILHYFGIHNGGYAINGKSLGLSAYYDPNNFIIAFSFGEQFISCSYNSAFDLQAYRSISTTGYENIEVSFDWKCDGEQWGGAWVDYGQVGYSLNGGSTFTWLSTGGPNNDGLYHSRTSTQSATVSFPAIVDDNSNFVLAFRAKADECTANQPAFIIDNIVVTGDALAGPPTCTTPIMPTDGYGSHSPADPLTWNAVGNATSYDVYFGTSSNPPFVTNTSGTTYSPALAENTTYYWKTVPKNAYGEPSGCAVWEFTTGSSPANGDYRSRYMDGVNRMWSTSSNWQIFNGSSWVTASDPPNGSTVNVLIRDNSKMIINGNYEINELRIEGLLQFYWGDGVSGSPDNTAKTLTVNGDIFLTGDADFQTNAAYDANRNFVHLLIAKKNIYNNANSGHGMLLNDYPEISYWSYVQVRFKGSGNAEWSGAGENDIGGLSILKDNPNDVVTIKPDQLLGWGSTDLDGNGFFMYDVIDHVGTLRIGGIFPMTTRFGIQSTNSSADDTRQLPQLSSVNSGSDFTLHIDNPNFGISGYSPVECYGKLRISQGTLNVGDDWNDYLEFLDGSSLTVEGGDLTCTGPIAYLGSGTFDFNLSGGRIRAGYDGNALSELTGWFDIRNNANVTISGGEIQLINPSLPTTNALNYPMYNMAASNVNITGGVLQLASDRSPTETNNFSIAGPSPSIELYGNGTSIASNAIMWDNVQCYGYLDIPEFCGLSIYDQDHGDTPYTFSITGNVNHEGNLYAEVEDSKILFNGLSAQTFHTTGAYSDVSGEAGISIVEVDNAAGVQLTGLSTAVTKNFIKTNGTFHIGACSLGLSGIVTRTNGYLGGSTNSELYISGDGTLGNLYFNPTENNLNLLEVDRQNTGIVNLATDVNVSGSIDFVNGTLYTYLNNDVSNGSQTVYLQPTASLNNEDLDSYLYGKVSVTETLSTAGEPGNIGANFTNLSENLGSTTIVRMTGDEGEQTIADATSIDCYWDINVGSQPTSPVLMNFEWLDVFDNNLSLYNLSVYSKHNTNPWVEETSPTTVSESPRVISANVDGYSRWTVAKKNNVLPVSLLYFDVQCNGQSKEFSWATASETNSDYFLIMESQDNVNFKPIAKIQAAGQSYQTEAYRYVMEGLSDDAYYRLKQVDYDGSSENFSMIYNSCEQDNSHEISVYPNPFNGNELNLLSSDYIGESQIKLYDTSGRIIRDMQYNVSEGNNAIRFNKKPAPGAYILEIMNTTTRFKQIPVIVK